MTRFQVKNLNGLERQYVIVRKDGKGSNHIFLAAPTYALLTPDQAMNLANTLVDIAEQLEQR